MCPDGGGSGSVILVLVAGTCSDGSLSSLSMVAKARICSNVGQFRAGFFLFWSLIHRLVSTIPPKHPQIAHQNTVLIYRCPVLIVLIP